MPRLTDTQLVILSAAAGRDDHAVLPLPKSLKIKDAAATRTLGNLRKKGLVAEQPAAREAPMWRQTGDGQRFTLVVTDAGLAAIDGKPAVETRNKPAPAKARPKQPRSGRKTSGSKPQVREAAPAIRQGTKQALLIHLLKRKRGATIDEAAEATGWQPHSVRGAISGTLKKRLGLAVTSEKGDGRGRVYRIAEAGRRKEREARR